MKQKYRCVANIFLFQSGDIICLKEIFYTFNIIVRLTYALFLLN